MNVFLRQLLYIENLPNHFFVKAYDARLLFVLSGGGELRLTDRVIPLSENSVCYYPAGTKYYPCSSEKSPMRVITVNFDFTRDYEHNVQSMPPVHAEDFDPTASQPTHLSVPFERFHAPFVLSDAAFLRDTFRRLLSEFHSIEPFARERAEALLRYCLYSILAYTPKMHSEVYNRMVRYLSANFTNVNSNEEVARVLNYHESYLNKILKENAGHTIHGYINLLRLNHAEQLLLSTEKSIEEISSECGFVNAKHFSTLFRKKFSVAPTQYRKRGKWI